jgi:hypothetical protein
MIGQSAGGSRKKKAQRRMQKAEVRRQNGECRVPCQEGMTKF